MRCGGHPEGTGEYHYHGEPYAISDADDALIGYMRDGSPIYGRQDPGGTIPTDLDAYGAHTGTTVDSPSTPVYHYHAEPADQHRFDELCQQQWFLTTGTYAHAPGSCTNC